MTESCISLAPQRRWVTALVRAAITVWVVVCVIATVALWQEVVRHPLLSPAPYVQAERARCNALADRSAQERCLHALLQQAFAHGRTDDGRASR